MNFQTAINSDICLDLSAFPERFVGFEMRLFRREANVIQKMVVQFG